MHTTLNANTPPTDDRTFGERLADRVVAGIGTWHFLIAQGAFITLWVIGNVWALRNLGAQNFDPFPFILLNLCLSIQAAVTGPLLLLASNRQSAKDRQMSSDDLNVDISVHSQVVALRDQVAELHIDVKRLRHSPPQNRSFFKWG